MKIKNQKKLRTFFLAFFSVTISFTTVAQKTISISATDKTATPTAEGELTVSTNSVNFTENGGSVTLYATSSNSGFGIKSEGGWVNVSLFAGNHEGTITITADANTGAAKIGSVIVSSGGLTKTISITQDAYTTPTAVGELTVSTNSVSFTESGGSVTLYATGSNSGFGIKSEGGWFNLSLSAGNHEGTITITADANTSTSSRSGTATVSIPGGGISRDISVYQQGAGTTANDPTPSGLSVWTAGKELRIKSDRDDIVYIYTLAGELIKTGNIITGEIVIPLPGGLYVVKSSRGSFKVNIR